MMPDEFTETFSTDGHSFKGIWTAVDARSPTGEPAIITRVERILVSDEDAGRLNDNSEILRLATGVTYLVKTSMRSGIGLTELDLEKKPDQPYQGEF